MKSESLQWKKLRPHLVAAKLDPVRVENPIHPGTPDVNLVCGWVELKSMPSWPVRAKSLLKISHFTAQQRVWLYRRWRFAPGSTYLLLEIREDKQWLLFDGDVAAKIVGDATAAQHRIWAHVILAERELAELPKFFAEPPPKSYAEVWQSQAATFCEAKKAVR